MRGPRTSPVRRVLAAVTLAALQLTILGACELTRLPRAAVRFPDSWPLRSNQAPVRGRSAMVSTAARLATDAGVSVLRRGGNAVDAAVAVGFALAVVLPRAGNIGGGGFMMIRLAYGEVFALDFREKAPLEASHDMYVDESGQPTDASLHGALAAGVPGTVMGLWEAHRRFGALPWADLVEPAIRLANGFEADRLLASSIRAAADDLEPYEGSREVFLPGGAPPREGETFRQPDLARTLARIRDGGADAFYGGETADLIVAEMVREAGLISGEDLAAYTSVWRDPITFDYRGFTVHSMPPPSSGGATMALMAHMLEEYDPAALGWHSTRMVHLMAEIWKRAYANRNQVLGDPDFVDLPLARMLSPEYAHERAEGISFGGATPSAEIGPGLEASEGSQTTHYSIVDRAGNAVAVTTTLNGFYGSGVTVEGAGFLLNNEMDDFATRPGLPNQFGLVQGERNAIEPGKRMLSSMTPTIVEGPEGDLRLVLGSPGGSTIITTVFQVLTNVVDYGMSLSQAVNAPRIHHQHLPDRIMYEAGGLPAPVVDSLEALGDVASERGGFSGEVQAIMLLGDGTRVGYSDPRASGTSRGY